MHVVVNTSSLPVYKKYRIAQLLCIFETLKIELNLMYLTIKCLQYSSVQLQK